MPLVLAIGLLPLVACGQEHRAAAQGSSESDRATTGAASTPGGSPAVSAPTDASQGAAPWTMPAVPEHVAEGIRVYRSNYCGTCHHNTLAGTAGVFGPNHDSLRVNAARRLRDPGYTGHATTPEGYVRESIRDPGAWRIPGFERTHFSMPAYTQLPDSEVDALVRMLLWQPPTEGR